MACRNPRYSCFECHLVVIAAVMTLSVGHAEELQTSNSED